MKNLQEKIRGLYIVAVISVLGVFSFASAIIIAWPALAHLASKLI